MVIQTRPSTDTLMSPALAKPLLDDLGVRGVEDKSPEVLKGLYDATTIFCMDRIVMMEGVIPPGETWGQLQELVWDFVDGWEATRK